MYWDLIMFTMITNECLGFTGPLPETVVEAVDKVVNKRQKICKCMIKNNLKGKSFKCEDVKKFFF